MTIPEWAYEIERTEYSDQIFSSIGRLLYHGTRYEEYCRLLFSVLKIKSNHDF